MPQCPYTQRHTQAIVMDMDVLIDAETNTAKPYALSTVLRLKRLGWPMALISSASEEQMNAAMDTLGVNGAFEVMHSSQNEMRGMPRPNTHLSAAKKLFVSPKFCISVGTSEDSVRASRYANMVSYGVAAEYGADVPMAHKTFNGLADLTVALYDEFRHEMPAPTAEITSIAADTTETSNVVEFVAPQEMKVAV